MKDITVGEFCRKFGACNEGREWAFSRTPKKSKAMMSEIWEYLSFENYLEWVISRDGVISDKDLRLFACRCVCETPISDGRKVLDLLTDERSRNAVIVAEKYANGEATKDELNAARDDAWFAARDDAWFAARDDAWFAALDAAWAASSAAARDAAWAASSAAARDAASAAASAAALDAARAAQKSFLENPFSEV